MQVVKQDEVSQVELVKKNHLLTANRQRKQIMKFIGFIQWTISDNNLQNNVSEPKKQKFLRRSFWRSGYVVEKKLMFRVFEIILILLKWIIWRSSWIIRTERYVVVVCGKLVFIFICFNYIIKFLKWMLQRYLETIVEIKKVKLGVCGLSANFNNFALSPQTPGITFFSTIYIIDFRNL